MLDLILHNQSKEYEQKWKQLMEQHTELLARCQVGEARYSGSLGWLSVSQWAGEPTLAAIEALAREIRGNADAFVLIGVGGSNNAARSVIEALGDGNGPEIIYGGNTLSANALNRMLARVRGKSIYIDCIAKNFETLEPGASFRLLRKYLYAACGEVACERIIATGTRGSSLYALCNAHGYRFMEFPDDIGGRYTAMTSVGLLPMAVAGVDIRALVLGASDMERQLRTQDAGENMAYAYACLRNVYYNAGYSLEMLSSFEPQFRYFYKWWIQLFAESEGKDSKGIFPVASEFSEDLHSVGQFIQDGAPIMFETFLDVAQKQDILSPLPDGLPDGFDYLNDKDFWKINQAAYEATVAAHSRRLPCQTIRMDALDAYHFGQLFYFFQFACYLSCGIMGVNPFDQPGVEAYKRWMFDALGK